MADNAAFESSRPEDARQDLVGQQVALDWPVAGDDLPGWFAHIVVSRIQPPSAQRRAAGMADGQDLDRSCGNSGPPADGSTSASAKRERRLQKPFPLRSALGG